jgi:hypothetical protein
VFITFGYQYTTSQDPLQNRSDPRRFFEIIILLNQYLAQTGGTRYEKILPIEKVVVFNDTFIRNLVDPLSHWHTHWLFPYPAELAKEERISLLPLVKYSQ